jgi:hypothetical protein
MIAYSLSPGFHPPDGTSPSSQATHYPFVISPFALQSGFGSHTVWPPISHDRKHRIFTMSFASVYPLYGRQGGKERADEGRSGRRDLLADGYNQRELEGQLKKQRDFETFFREAPQMNPARTLIKGVVCGVPGGRH